MTMLTLPAATRRLQGDRQLSPHIALPALSGCSDSRRRFDGPPYQGGGEVAVEYVHQQLVHEDNSHGGAHITRPGSGISQQFGADRVHLAEAPGGVGRGHPWGFKKNRQPAGYQPLGWRKQLRSLSKGRQLTGR